MKFSAPCEQDIAALHALLSRGPCVALTGAGISTASGIPDYRGPETRRRARNPIQYREFMRSAEARRRYWARSMLGWPRFSGAQPNVGHRMLARLEQQGLVSGLITQNVDSLHQAGGSRQVIELHGALRTTRCMSCAATAGRAELQQALCTLNPSFEQLVTTLAPDGDAELPDEWLREFKVVGCASCGGDLRPDVVFFGENVPAERVASAFTLLENASSLLVVGSSLAVYSGLRFVHRAHQAGTPVAIVCLGPTRGDAYASVRIEADASATLLALARRAGIR